VEGNLDNREDIQGSEGLPLYSVSDVSRSHKDWDENVDNNLVVVVVVAARNRLPHLPTHVVLVRAYALDGGNGIHDAGS
jgi:hypothetical protein